MVYEMDSMKVRDFIVMKIEGVKEGSAIITATSPNGAYMECEVTVTAPHTHLYNAPTYDWSNDYTTCAATFTCIDGDATQTVECEVTSEMQEATCNAVGQTVYTATVTMNGNTYTDIKKVTIDKNDNHQWDDGVVTVPATSTEDGVKTYTCTRCGAMKTEAIPKTESVTQVFSDVPVGAWYIDAVQYVYDNGIMKGEGYGIFAPNAPMTRAMVAQIMYALAGSPTVSGDMPFTDVPAGRWYYDAVLWANQNGVVVGMGDGTFAPNNNITRQEYAAILYRYENSPAVSGSLNFPDANEVSSWAKDAILWANQNSIINGTVNDNGITVLDPKGTATRAQSAMILRGYLEK